MVLRPGRDDAARALLAMLAVVVDPGFAQHLAAEAPVPFLVLPAIAGEGVVLLGGKGVRRRAQPDHWPPRVDVVDDVSHLVVGQIAKARKQHEQVGRLRALRGPGYCRTGWD